MTYSNAIAKTMKHAQNHNMLFPVVKTGNRPGASNPAHVAVIPEATGDATAFNATINGGVLWPDFYKSWKLSFTSPTATEITITDDTILDIADDCGLPNLAHFYKLFAARFGTTPRRYRMQAQLIVGRNSPEKKGQRVRARIITIANFRSGPLPVMHHLLRKFSD